MALFLSQRNEQLTERMDDPSCDLEMLFNTYRQFTNINRLLAGWGRIYRTQIKPVIQNHGGRASLLDIGCGGGDIIRYLCKLCKADQFKVQFTGIDPDKRAHQFLSVQKPIENIQFLKHTSAELVKEKYHFDIVISNHLLHHLTESQMDAICNDAVLLAKEKIIFNDIERHPAGFAAFKTIAPLLFKNSFIVEDGLTSIRRSYKKNELEHALPHGWIVKRQFPFRLLAIYEPEDQ
jgi:2-polyprenyl-3-methyl-5-hydroxy-6-metoxy-1,4-benzoquinol methylase